MASLPPAYSLLLNDLNRDVLRAQPPDPLQFCASWFFTRLEQERSAYLTASQSHSSPPYGTQWQGVTPPAVLGMVPAPPVRLSEQPGLSRGEAEGYRFGTGGIGAGIASSNPGVELVNPFNEVPPLPSNGLSCQMQIPPVADQRRASPILGSAADRDGAADFLVKRVSAAIQANDLERESQSDGEEDEEGDSLAAIPSVHRPPSSVAAAADIPKAYNLGRRTSVSAESLTPSAFNAPPPPKIVIPKTPSQKARIELSIQGNLLFRNLDEGQYSDVVNAMKEVRISRGTEVIVQGAVGDYFYVVEEGTFEAWVKRSPSYSYMDNGTSGWRTVTNQGPANKVASYGPGGSFGELALMYNAPRAATVVATSNSATLWALDRVTFRSILMEHTARKRTMYETFLASVPILASLTAAERAKVADALDEREYQEGEPVVREGEKGEEFYLVVRGRAEVAKQRGNGEEVVGSYGKGDYFGELALINSAPRAATVRASQGPLLVASLKESAFTRLLGSVIEILSRKAAEQYRLNPSAAAPSPSVSGSSAGGGGYGEYGNGAGHVGLARFSRENLGQYKSHVVEAQ